MLLAQFLDPTKSVTDLLIQVSPYIALILGLMVGSFLNVLAYRMPRECLSIVFPDSHCPKCGNYIHWYQNIPLLSYVFLGGQCANCHCRIGWRYFAVEAFTGILFFLTALAFLHLKKTMYPGLDIGVLAALLCFSGLMMAISLIDFDWTIIPDELSIGGALFIFVMVAFFPAIQIGEVYTLPHIKKDAALNFFFQDSPRLTALTWSAIGAATGAGIIYCIKIFGTIFFQATGTIEEGQSAMGTGDIKLMLLIGAFLGWSDTVLALFCACIIGSVIGVLWKYILRRGKFIPFGPFLATGALVMALLPDRIYHLLELYKNTLHFN